MSSKTSIESKCYTMEEVARHTNPARSVWIVINGNVLDVTSFLRDHAHPGGDDILRKYAGKDASSIFNAAHSTDAKELAESYIIGKLASKQTNK